MNILCIGDVVGSNGCQFLRDNLSRLKKEKNIDIVIINGENSADGNGITPASAEFLFASGADVITTGNHCFRRSESYDMFENEEFLLRPINLSKSSPGHGSCIIDKGRIQIGVVNLIGNTYMDGFSNAFEAIDTLLKKGDMPKITVVDFHAEATGEKNAMAFYLDGRVSAMFGTHTHIQTSDAKIMKKGMGYITDVGMTGVEESVLGVIPENVIKKLSTGMPARFDYADGECKMEAVIFSIDEKSGKTVSVEALRLK